MIKGFWSYVHADDDVEGGRITQLARDVVDQYEMQTAESINLFLDRDDLQWGDNWRSVIDSNLSSVAFFVPVISPRYFKSAECRRELNLFARRAEKLGLQGIVLPVVWIDFPGLHEEDPKDDLLELVRKFQWSDWSALKFSERSSGEYRKATADLANRLIRANDEADLNVALGGINSETIDSEDSYLGSLDKLAAMEQSLPHMAVILTEASHEVEEVGSLMRKATDEIGKNNNPSASFGVRLRVARNLAENLSIPTSSIRDLGNEFSSTLNDVDEGVRVIISGAPAEIAADSESAIKFEDFFRIVRDMVKQSESGLGEIKNLIAQTGPLEKVSRDLRKPLRILREGLTLFTDGLTIMRDWLRLVEEAEGEINRNAESDAGETRRIHSTNL